MSSVKPQAARSVILGIDLGGTKIATGLVDPQDGSLVLRRLAPTPVGAGAAEILKHVQAETRALLREAGQSGFKALGVGFGICEIVDRHGRIRSAALADLRGLDLDAALGLDLPIVTVADVRAAALAELRFGAARGVRDGLYVSIGTGISTSLILDGQPYPGAHGAALVIGSAQVETVCDGCGNRTMESLEDFAAGRGIERTYDPSLLIPAHEIIRRASAGEPKAVMVVTRAARHAGAAIGQLSNCTDPEVIVIGGGLGCSEGLYADELSRAIHAVRWLGMPEVVQIRPAMLGPDSGVVGAAMAVCETFPVLVPDGKLLDSGH